MDPKRKSFEVQPTLIAALAAASKGNDNARAMATMLIDDRPDLIRIVRACLGWSQRDLAVAVEAPRSMQMAVSR